MNGTQTKLFAAAAITAAVLVMMLGGCAQRSLQAVRESGERHYDLGQYNEALTDFEEYVQRMGGDPDGRYNLGRTYLAVNRPVPARENLWIAYKQRSSDPKVVDALCDSLVAAKANDELYTLLRQRCLDRLQVSDYLRLAKYSQQLGDADEARTALLTAARIDKGESLEVQLALCDFYASVKDRENAMRRIRMAYFLDPRSNEVARRMKDLGAIAGPTFALKPEEMP